MKTAFRSILLALGLLGLGTAAHAQLTITTWTGGGTSAFNDSANWDNGAPDINFPGGEFMQVGVVNSTVTVGADANADMLAVGSGTTGSLTINSGAVFTAHYVGVGEDEHGAGSLTVDGAGSTLTLVDGGLHVGDASLTPPTFTPTGPLSGSLTVSNGGKINGGVNVAFDAFATGTVLVTGNNSTVTGGIYGGYGTAHITVSNSATVQSGISGGSGNIDITINSGAHVDGGLNIGDGGAGSGTTSTFTVSGGATLTNGSIVVNTGSTSSATGTITGGNHTALAFNVGGYGTNNLTIQGGAIVNGSDVGNYSIIGNQTGASGTITLTGASAWTSGAEIHVGEGGTGTLNIQGGSSVSTVGMTSSSDPFDQAVYVGNNGGSVGTINVDGSGSTLTTGAFRIGTGGSGTVNITNGGVVTTDSTAGLGAGSGSSGAVTVSGTGSTWNLTDSGSSLEVGTSGTGSVTVSAGGTVTNAGITTIGAANGSHGSVTVTGAGSSFTSASTVTLSPSNGASGTLTLANGGLFTITHGTLSLGQAPTGFATLNIGAAANQSAALPGTLVFTEADTGASPTYGIIRSGFGTGTIVFNHTSNSYAFSPVMDGGVNILQKTGTTILTGGTDGFGNSGTTTVDGGILRLGVNNAFGSGALTLGGGTLDLNHFSQTAGTLTLAGNANSYIDFNSLASTLALADSSAIGWNGTLTLLNFDGSDSFRVGTTSGGLTGTQLSLIDINGFIAAIDGSGFITQGSTVFTASAVPEPSTYAALAGLAALGLAAWRRRARLEVQAEQQL